MTIVVIQVSSLERIYLCFFFLIFNSFFFFNFFFFAIKIFRITWSDVEVCNEKAGSISCCCR